VGMILSGSEPSGNGVGSALCDSAKMDEDGTPVPLELNQKLGKAGTRLPIGALITPKAVLIITIRALIIPIRGTDNRIRALIVAGMQ
jgi:hypothetical protein